MNNFITNQMMTEFNNFDYDLGEVAKIHEPETAMEALLAYLGNTFQCERVYIFEKNGNGAYDCTKEWCSEETFSKKHLLQNIDEYSVRFYYNYFIRGKKLVFRDIEQFKQEDYTLYNILKPQNLYSLLCGQLVYDDKDMGFIGIDNPSVEKFDELENIFEVINYFISIQIHKKNVLKRVTQDGKLICADDSNLQIYNQSLYNRVFHLKLENPLVLIYCAITNFGYYNKKEENSHMVKTVGNVLGSIFSEENVFSIGNEEFLIIYDQEDTSNVEDYIILAERTLETMNIPVSIGKVYTEQYREDFFQLLNHANINMIQKKRNYRHKFLDKYQMNAKTTTYRNLVEIRPESDYYQVLYTEYTDISYFEGRTELLMKYMYEHIHTEDRKKFLEFWKAQLELQREDIRNTSEVVKETFMMSPSNNGSYIRVTISVLAYTDINENIVLISYIK